MVEVVLIRRQFDMIFSFIKKKIKETETRRDRVREEKGVMSDPRRLVTRRTSGDQECRPRTVEVFYRVGHCPGFEDNRCQCSFFVSGTALGPVPKVVQPTPQ